MKMGMFQLFRLRTYFFYFDSGVKKGMMREKLLLCSNWW